MRRHSNSPRGLTSSPEFVFLWDICKPKSHVDTAQRLYVRPEATDFIPYQDPEIATSKIPTGLRLATSLEESRPPLRADACQCSTPSLQLVASTVVIMLTCREI